MRLPVVDHPKAAIAARALARVATGASALSSGIAVYSALAGGMRLRMGPIRVSSGGWWHPFTQAVWLGAAAAWLFYQDALLRGGSWDWVPRIITRFMGGSATRPARRASWTLLVLGSLTSLLVTYCIARQSLVLGSYEGGWIYAYLQPFSVRPIAVGLVVSAAAALGLAMSGGRALERREWLVVFGWVCLALGLQAAVRSLTPFSFGEMFASGVANSFYSVTRQFDASAVLGDFNRLRDSWPIHAHSNMPGKLMLVYALELFSTHPGVLAWLVVLLSNLGGVLFYIFVREVFDDRQVALFSLALYLFVPGKLFFFPLLNVVTPAIVCACALLMLRWLRTGRAAYAAALGVAVFGLALFEPVPLVMVSLLFVALAGRTVRSGTLTAGSFTRQAGVYMAAFLATYALMYFTFGFDLVDALRRVLADASDFNVRAARPYSVWIRQNPFDFLFGVGACQAVVFGIVLIDGIRRNGWTDILLARPITLLSAVLAAILIATDLAGVGRGEVVRLWIFLACFFQIPTAYLCARLNSRLALALVLTVTILQSALGTSMIGFVIP